MILTCKLNPKHCAKQKKPKIKKIYIKSGDGREESRMSLLPGLPRNVNNFSDLKTQHIRF